MDRNIRYIIMHLQKVFVALRKESVDRNRIVKPSNRAIFVVALRKESVDRNRLVAGSLNTLGGSLSARRAWIEITQCRL